MTSYTLNSRSVEPVKADMSNEPVIYSKSDLSVMTVSQIKALAVDLGYSITKTLKADVINEFLAQQG